MLETHISTSFVHKCQKSCSYFLHKTRGDMSFVTFLLIQL